MNRESINIYAKVSEDATSLKYGGGGGKSRQVKEARRKAEYRKDTKEKGRRTRRQGAFTMLVHG
jgi:hypothetical protein